MNEGHISIGQALDYGTGLAIQGKHDSAVEIFKGVLIADPDNFEAKLRLGTSLFELGRYHEALYWFWRGRKQARRHPLALMNYGLCLSQLGHPEEGLPDLERAVALLDKAPLPNQAKAQVYNNLGNTLERLERHAEALPVLQKGIALDPDDPFPWYNLGIVLLRLNRHREALAALNESIVRQRPGESRLNEADAYYNRAMAHLLLGELGEGFIDYEARLVTTETDPPCFGLDPALKLKPGEDINGKTILLHCEQGLGDTIQFMRFVPELCRRGAEICTIAHSAIRTLLYDPRMNVLPTGQKLAGRNVEGEEDAVRYDRWVAICSLPYVFGLEREDQIPPPWCFPLDCERVDRWAATLPPSSFRVGVCWAGNFRHKNDRHRSVPLATFAKLFELPYQFVSVQQMRLGEEAELAELQKRHSNLTVLALDDFRDTAAVLLNCNLVVTADTSVAHLAGTLGSPTWILIPKSGTDWRWQLERTDSPWYPSVRLYRQAKIGDWRSILDCVKRDLAETAAQRAAAYAA